MTSIPGKPKQLMSPELKIRC